LCTLLIYVLVLAYYYQKHIQMKVTYANIVQRIDNVHSPIESLMQMNAYKLTTIPVLNKNSKCVQVSLNNTSTLCRIQRWNKDDSQSTVLDIKFIQP
jgi:glycogen debranching enzyme